MKTYYMSFVDPDLPEGHRWLGACLVKAEDHADATRKSWIAGCNPGGEILFVEPEREPNMKWFYRLLNKDHLMEMGAEVVAEHSMPSSENKLLNPHTGEVIRQNN